MTQPDAHFFALQEALAGKYSLETELGRGGMGIVYLALDVQLDRPVALKVLPEHLASNQALRERFLREARTAAKLSHPNIVPIHSVDVVGDFVFFAMAYVAGESLGERIKRRGPLAPSECLRILREVSFALSYAHSQGVIHRDIKPDNILLEEGTGRALVADFGIAGIVGDADALEEGEIVGTVEFMSPEQAAGKRLDFRSDLYSLGMVAYYALTGNLPFTSDSVTTTLEHVRNTPVPSVESVTSTAPRRLARIIDKCLKKDPDHRFDSADQMAEALEALSTARKQIPVAVRSFLYDPIDLGGDAPAYFTIASLAALPMVAATLQLPGFGAILAAFAAFVVGAPTVLVPPRVRRLISSGNGIADLEIGLRQDLEQRKEESPQLPRSRFSRIRSLLRKASLAGMGGSWSLFWAMTMLLFGGAFDLPMEVYEGITITLLTIGSASTAGFVLASIAPGRDDEQRSLGKAERRLRFWQSPLGKTIFKLSGVGLRKSVAEVRATHRPTEIQIGLAVEALFAALPKETRKEVGDVPAIVERLENDARQLRELVSMLREAEFSSPQGDSRFPSDLRERRENAEGQLSEVVAALETIRLELLRLTAGVGSVEGLTTHLLAAGRIQSDVGHLVEGLEEMEAALRRSNDESR